MSVPKLSRPKTFPQPAVGQTKATRSIRESAQAAIGWVCAELAAKQAKYDESRCKAAGPPTVVKAATTTAVEEAGVAAGAAAARAMARAAADATSATMGAVEVGNADGPHHYWPSIAPGDAPYSSGEATLPGCSTGEW